MLFSTWLIKFLNIILCSLILSWNQEENIAIFRRYIAEISCVEGYRHDFSCRNIGQMIFRDKSREIGDLSRYIDDFSSIYRLVNAGSTESTRYSKSQMCYSVPATVHLPNNLLLLPRGFEPQTKRFGVQPSCHLG